MRKQLIIGITAAIIGGATLTAGVASADGKWDRCGDRGEGRGKYEQMEGHGHKGYKRLKYMAEELDLTDAQQDQMKQLFRDQRNAMMDQKDSFHDMREAMRDLDVSAADYDQQVASLMTRAEQNAAAMVKMRAEQKKAIFELLTPEQQSEFLEMKR